MLAQYGMILRGLQKIYTVNSLYEDVILPEQYFFAENNSWYKRYVLLKIGRF